MSIHPLYSAFTSLMNLLTGRHISMLTSQFWEPENTEHGGRIRFDKNMHLFRK